MFLSGLKLICLQNQTIDKKHHKRLIYKYLFISLENPETYERKNTSSQHLRFRCVRSTNNETAVERNPASYRGSRWLLWGYQL